MPMPDVQEHGDLRPAPIRPERTPIEALRSRALFLAALTAAGALAGLGAGLLLPVRYRAVASLLVAEPRLAGPSGVDFNLTPVRSYAALAGSRALAAPCRAALGRGAADAAEVKVRVPESTRVVELSYAGRSAEAAAAFVSCVAQRAIAENDRINAALARQGAEPAAAALAAAKASLGEAERHAAEWRGAALLESKRAALRAALDAADEASQEELRAALAAEEAAARRGALEGADGRSAAADEAGARARKGAAAAAREASTRRVAALEREVAASEQRLDALKREVEQAQAAVTEVGRRAATAPLEGAAKSFSLVLVSPAVPPARPTRPPASLVALCGGAAVLAFGVLLSLSRP